MGTGEQERSREVGPSLEYWFRRGLGSLEAWGRFEIHTAREGFLMLFMLRAVLGSTPACLGPSLARTSSQALPLLGSDQAWLGCLHRSSKRRMSMCVRSVA